jgi:hypothetical protein
MNVFMSLKTTQIKSAILSLLLILLINSIKAQPVIDAKFDSPWESANYFIPTKLVKNTPGDDGPSENDLSGKFYTLWDENNFYLFIEVTDDKIYTNIETDHQNDNIEVYFDLNNSKQSVYDGIDDDQLRFISGIDTINSKRLVTADKLEFAQKTTDDGYVFEIRFPWAALTSEDFTASEGIDIGFDLMITDNDGSDKKDYILAWNSPSNDAWQWASIFGTMKLLGTGTTERVIGENQAAEHDEYDINEANVSSILYVDNNAANADDSNDGSLSSPFLTIEKALEVASENAGEGIATRVSIAPGTYRESGLLLRKTGNPYKFMNTEVVIEGQQKGEVIISGSEIRNDGWSAYGDNTYTHVWKYAVSVEKPWKDKGPSQEIATRREMVFVGGEWMKQVMQLESLEDNSFYVDEANDLLYVKVANSIDFENSNKEIGLHGDGETAPWPPSRLFSVPLDKDKVVLRNLVFQHANMRLSESTVKIQGWKVLMEDCIVRWNNGVGLNIAGDCEHITLRNNIIDYNGGSGMTTWGVSDLTLSGNSTSNNNWRGHLGSYHTHAIGGIKFHHAKNVIVEDHVSKGNWAPGLWSDLEITNITYNNCTVENNYGPGFLIEISEEVYLNNCTIVRNIPGIRCHSSHDVYIDSCMIKGNAVQFTVYKDHRDFSSTDWTSQFEGRIWDKKPDNWNITNCTIEAVDDPEWQEYADKKMPSWIHYTNPGYQAFWHFSHADYMSTFFGGATIAYENNIWVHPATDTPFKDDEGNDLTVDEWELWISGFATGDKAIEIIDGYAKNNDASALSVQILTNAGAEEVIDDYLNYYKSFIEALDSVEGLNDLQTVIDKSNSFGEIAQMALNNDASELTINHLLDAGVTFRTDRMAFYKIAIENEDEITSLDSLQQLIDNTTSIQTDKAPGKYVLYPVPAKEKLFVKDIGQIKRIIITDMSGKMISFLLSSGREKRCIDVSDLSPGFYILFFVDKKASTIQRKILIER